MPNILDIIQRIAIEGDKAIIQSLKAVGDAGENAFSKIGGAVDKITTPFRNFQRDTDNVRQRAENFGRSIGETGAAIGTFAERIGLTGAALTGLGVKILSSTLGIATALNKVSTAENEAKLAVREHATAAKEMNALNTSQANAVDDLNRKFRQHVATINDTRNAHEDLDRQLAAGTINKEQYAKAEVELTFQVARANREAFEAHVKEQRNLREDQERARQDQIEKQIALKDIIEQEAREQAANQKAAIANELHAKFGAQLTGVLLQLANVLDNVRQRFLSTFGPTIANFLTSFVTAIADAAPQIFAVFEKVSKAIEQAFNSSGLTAKDVVTGIVKFLGQLATAFTTIVVPAVKIFIGVLQTVAEAINSVFGGNLTAGGILAAAIVLKLSGLFGVLSGAIKIVFTAIQLFGAAFGPVGIIIGILIALILTQLIPVLMKIDWAAVGKAASDVWKYISDQFNIAVQFIKDLWSGITDFFRTKIQAIMGFIDRLIAKVKEFLGLTGDASGSSLANDAGINDIGKFSEGGQFRGKPGIDTNLAWLTDEEFVMKRSAVRHWGVGFMNMINNMRNPFRGYSTGGLVASLAPSAPRMAFASGGPVGRTQQRPLVLQIGDEIFDGLTAQDNTVDDLQKFAARRGVRSQGRKPLWFGGGSK
jgi:phage-related protein